MSLEKKYQAEYSHTLMQYGFALKNKDLEICPRCHNKIHPQNSGIPDLFFQAFGGLSSFIECKGGDKGQEDRLNFSQIEPHQWDYYDYLFGRTGRKVWLMMMTGDLAVNAKGSMRRRLWLLPMTVVKSNFEIVERISGYKYIPVHNGVGRMSKYPSLCMDYLWASYELERENGDWVLPYYHEFYSYNNLIGRIDDNRNPSGA